MKTKKEISNLTDDELIAYGDELSIITKAEIVNIQNKYNLEKGILNYHGEGKEYLKADLKLYYTNFVKIVNKYILPIEEELVIRMKGTDECYSELHSKIYTDLNIEKLKYFESNIKIEYIGRVSPNLNQPFWYTHLRKVHRYGKQEDYKLIVQMRERENKLKGILND